MTDAETGSGVNVFVRVRWAVREGRATLCEITT